MRGVTEIRDMTISLLLITVVMFAGSGIISSLTSEVITDLPGYQEGKDLRDDIDSYIGTFEDTTQDDSSIGVGGVVLLIKDVVLSTPGYMSKLMSNAFETVGIDSSVPGIFRAIIYIIAIFAGILLLRGIIR